MKTLADLSAYIAWLTWAVGGIAVVSIAALVMDLWMFRILRRKDSNKTETEILMDAIDGLRAQIDLDQQHTIGEHRAQAKVLHSLSGGMQFLKSTTIAEELAAQRAREAADRKDDP